MKVLPSLFNYVYSRVKLFVFAMNSRRRYSIFVCSIHGLKEMNSKSEVVFAVCRLPLTSSLTSLNYCISSNIRRCSCNCRQSLIVPAVYVLAQAGVNVGIMFCGLYKWCYHRNLIFRSLHKRQRGSHVFLAYSNCALSISGSQNVAVLPKRHDNSLFLRS